MNRLKHYHLGCGEPLQSQHSALMLMNKTACVEQEKFRAAVHKKGKPGKRH